MSMNFNEFCLAWKSQISMFLTFGLELSEIIWNIKNQKWFGSGKVSGPFVLIFDICESLLLIYREELVREEMCVEYLDNLLHDNSKEFDIPQL